MPPPLLDLVLLVGGLAVLTVAADRFALGAARLSAALRLSPVLIGAVVIGFGTSAPELVVTVLATLSGSQDLAFGNVVGSNTANVLLVLGAGALASPLAVRSVTLRRELPLMLAAVALLALVTADGVVSSLDALVLLAAALVVLGLLVRTALADRETSEEMSRAVTGYAGAAPHLPRTVAMTVLGLVGTLAGAQALVSGSVGLARAVGISEAVIGLTVVAIGTSLPELGTAVAAARRRETDLVVGNVLGSNIFNALPVAGIAGLLDTVRLAPTFRPSLAVMVGACALTAVFLATGRRIARVEAMVLLILFAGVTVGTVALS